MFKSRQRLGDDPRDHDGHLEDYSEDHADVFGVRTDAAPPGLDASSGSATAGEKWKIYPKPPPPHWHWRQDQVISADGAKHVPGDSFKFEECHIPGEIPGMDFKLDTKGVFQVHREGGACDA
jgi:AMP deaminase